MPSLYSRAASAFDEGLQAVGRPFAEPGTPIATAEPFAPGTTSVGALTGKLIRNIIAGSRMGANSREVGAAHQRGVERDALEMQRLQQQIEAGEMVDFEGNQVPRSSLGPLLGTRIAHPTAPPTPFNEDVTKVGSAAWYRKWQADHPRGAGGAGGPKAPNLNMSQKMLDATVQRELDTAMNTLAAPRGRTLAAQARAGNRRALEELRINPDVWALATTDDSVNARTARSLLEQQIASGLKDWTERIGLYFKDKVQRKYAGKYKRLADSADAAAQLEDEAVVEADPNAAFEEQVQGALGGF